MFLTFNFKKIFQHLVPSFILGEGARGWNGRGAGREKHLAAYP